MATNLLVTRKQKCMSELACAQMGESRHSPTTYCSYDKKPRAALVFNYPSDQVNQQLALRGATEGVLGFPNTAGMEDVFYYKVSWCFFFLDTLVSLRCKWPMCKISSPTQILISIASFSYFNIYTFTRHLSFIKTFFRRRKRKRKPAVFTNLHTPIWSNLNHIFGMDYCTFILLRF